MLLDYTLSELSNELALLGEKPFRAKQIWKWLQAGVPIEEMTNLSGSLREKLQSHFSEGFAHPIKVMQSTDGTKKYLFEMEDKNTVESVFMVNNYGNSVCLSTQVGCRMGCVFCQSCKSGLVRNLSAGEILSQYIAMNREEGAGRNIANIVLMGMGEPLDNYDNVIKFLHLAHEVETFNISFRNISLSTCGIVPRIYELADSGLPVTLCISLHAPTDEKRRQLLPIANKWSVAEIIEAAKTYFEKTGRRIIIEYALIKDLNDKKEDVQVLRELLDGINCHINIIPLNQTSNCRYSAPLKREVYAFCKMLENAGLSATVRRSLGADIFGSCGQLKNNTVG